MKNIIFVDLDETLIHTFMPFWGETPTKDAETIIIAEPRGKEKDYQVVLRQGALYFLQILRSLGDVYMLTAAPKDYAIAMSGHFGLGFTDSRIYSREDIQGNQADPAYFGRGVVYLYDNLPQYENRSKINFLRNLGNVNYIQVEEFYNNKNASLTHEYIKKLVSNIK